MNIKFQHEDHCWVDSTTPYIIARYLFNNRFDNPTVWDYQTDDTVNWLFYQEGNDLISFQFMAWQIYDFVDWLMEEKEILRPRDKKEEDLEDLFYERVNFLFINYIKND